MLPGDAGPCPTEEELAELLEGGFAAVPHLEAHLARCSTCRDALAGAAEATTSASPSPRDPWGQGATLAPGTVIARYRVVELIGSGAMGSVYLAHDTELERRVAIKVLRPDDPDETRDLTRRLRREAKAMAKLSHPNVVTVFDVGASDGRLFLAMELVDGGTLGDWLAAAPRSWREIVNVFLLAGRGLSAAHSAGLVHRDFKPENVLVTPGGDVRVTDFGLARTEAEGPPSSVQRGSGREALGGESVLTRTGTLVGTPAYMAPEQLDRRTADARSDQFSFCVTLWQALYGRRPFAGGTVGELRSAIRGSHVAVDKRADVPPTVRDALLVGLRDDPDRRHPSMAPLLDVLAKSVRPRRRGGARRVLGVSAIAAAVLACAVAAYFFARARSTTRAVLAAPAASALRPVTLLDLAAPPSKSPDADAAFADGMHALHDGSWARARDAFERAVTADPTFATAHLRLGLVTSGNVGTISRTRLELQKAVELRAHLTERDRVFLDAVEPTMLRAPADKPESVARLRAAIERYPGDAELHLWLGYSILDGTYARDEEAALPSFVRAGQLDPAFADALESQARALAWLGRVDEARGVFARCRAIPTANDCLYWLTFLEAAAGDCAACERAAEWRINRDPLGVAGHRNLADAVLALGRPADAIRASLEQSWRLLADVDRPREEEGDEAALAIVLGDFVAAREHAERQLALVDSDPDATNHFVPTKTLIQLAFEVGDRERAEVLAADFVTRAGAWATSERTYNKGLDELPWLLEVAHRGGRLSDAELSAAQDRWLERWTTAMRPTGYLWVPAYAEAVESADDARAALAKLDPDSLPPFFLTPRNVDLVVGRVFARAGRVDEAAPHLERAAKHCARLADPFAHPQAELELGLVRESKGDVGGACEAYAAVLAQWGHAKPRSLTAERARERTRALRCSAAP